jgi:hypothetical protein
MIRAISFFACLLILGLTTAALGQNRALLIFGGDGHRTFLGCLNCAKHSPGSVCNAYGTQGSRYQSESIWNPYGTFGSKYSSNSPWNRYSSSAPIIVDQEGNSYGYFSMNKYHRNRTRIKSFLALFEYHEEEDDLEKVRQAYCGE